MIEFRKRRKVCFVTTGLAYGGAETQLLRLATSLRARTWEVMIISLIPPKAYVEELEAVGIPFFSLGIKHKVPDPKPFFQLARLIQRWKPQIVHSFMVHANFITRLVRPFAPVPVLISSARNTIEGGRLRELLYRLTDPFCDLTTQVSQVGLERYVRVGAVPQHKIRYIPNGVDTDHFKPNYSVRTRLRKKMSIEDRFVWLAVGRFVPQKDYFNMLHAFAYVVRERPEAVLLIAGDGPLRREMEKLAYELGVGSRIRFLGIRRDVQHLMNVADAYVLSSAFEGMANVLLEASASAIPIVATDVGGNSEIVLNESTGFLVPPKQPEALAQVMLRLMTLPVEKRRGMGRAARRHVEANFGLHHVVDLWENLYQDLLKRKGLL